MPDDRILFRIRITQRRQARAEQGFQGAARLAQLDRRLLPGKLRQRRVCLGVRAEAHTAGFHLPDLRFVEQRLLKLVRVPSIRLPDEIRDEEHHRGESPALQRRPRDFVC